MCQVILTISKPTKWKYEFINKKGQESTENRLLYNHCYYNGTRAEKEKKTFIKRLKLAETAFLKDSCSDSQNLLIEKYFVTDNKNNTLTAKHNQKAIDEHMQTFGYFMLLSNHISEPGYALSIYRNKDVVEKTFCNLKNRLDMKRTKVSSEESLEGKFFVQFISLIFISYIHKVMVKHNLYKNYSMASLLDEIDVIERLNYSGKKTHFSEVTEKQRDILNSFNVSLFTTL